MIRFLAHHEIDKQAWDRRLEQSSLPLLYGSSWYLDCVCPNWSALVDEETDAIFPLTQRRKFGFHYLFQPAFTQQLGLFEKKNSISQLSSFLEKIPDKFKLIEIQLNETNRATALPEAFHVQERKTHHLSLAADYAALSKAYNENLQRNLRKAATNQLTIENSSEYHSLIQLFRENKGKEIVQLKDREYAILNKLLGEAGKRKLTEIIYARDAKGGLIAGAVFLKSFDRYIFLFSARNEDSQDQAGMPLLIDHFMRQHNGENCILDFEGSMIPGLARFYKSFGSHEVVYLQIRKNKLPFILRRLK